MPRFMGFVLCGVDGCGKEAIHKGRRLCAAHYHRYRRSLKPKNPLRNRNIGDVVKTAVVRGKEIHLTQGAIDSFWMKVNKTDTCWIWTAFTDRQGYGRFGLYKTCFLAHRFAYELVVGPVPEGLCLDHLCRNTSCVNPAHMEPVTNDENRRRGVPYKTHCKKGHPYDEENTYINPARGGFRSCRQCNRDSVKNNYRNKKMNIFLPKN